MNYPSFFEIHFFIVPREIIKAINNYLIYNLHYFSVKLLLKTFFSPWKRQITQRQRLGFNLSDWFSTFSFNLISSGIGMFVRFFMIIFALLMEIVILIVGILFLIFSLIFPIVSLLTYTKILGNKKWSNLRKSAKTKPDEFIKSFVFSSEGVFVLSRLGISSIKFLQDFAILSKKIYGEFVNSFDPENLKNGDLFLILSRDYPPLSEYFVNLRIDFDLIEEVVKWYQRIEEYKNKKDIFWSRENLLRQKSLGIYWSYGYTPNLDKYSLDLMINKNFSDRLIGRNAEVSQIENVLSKDIQTNVILCGEQGVGKKTVIYQLAKNILEGNIAPELKHKKVVELNINAIIGEGGDSISAQNKFEDILYEAFWAGNIVLVIPNFDRFVSQGDGRIDLSPVFEKYAKSSGLQIIGLVTPDYFQKYVFPNASVSKNFTKIDISAPTKEMAIEILELYSMGREAREKLMVTFPAIREAVVKSERYITDIPFPEKAIDLLEEAIVSVRSGKRNLVLIEDVDRVLSEKIKVPVGELTKDEKEKLIDLENVIHKRLIGQDEAVIDLANAFRRTRLQLGQRKKPAGVFLFLGPTGVGKTETAKALAEAYFGSEERLVRLDMNEYQDISASNRLLGYFEQNEPGILIKLIRENPFCVLLLDEIEKANKNILNLFLTAFDEGYMTDNFGKKVSLQEMIIVATSNAGAEFIRKKIDPPSPADLAGFGGISEHESFKKELINHLLTNNIFSPEFLNRFDSVVIYKPLEKPQLLLIAKLLLNKLNERISDRGIKIKITDLLLDQVASLGFDPVFGARPMKRLIQDKIEAPLAQKILLGEAEKGTEIEFDLIQ